MSSVQARYLLLALLSAFSAVAKNINVLSYRWRIHPDWIHYISDASTNSSTYTVPYVVFFLKKTAINASHLAFFFIPFINFFIDGSFDDKL